MKRSVKVLLTLMIIIICFQAIPSNSIYNFSVFSTPNTISSEAIFRFSFCIEKDLWLHAKIRIVFPKEITFTPPLPEKENETRKNWVESFSNSIWLNNEKYMPCGMPVEIEILDDYSIQITLISIYMLKAKSNAFLEIIFDKNAGIITPDIPGEYSFKMYTDKEPEKKATSLIVVSQIDSNSISGNICFS